MAKLDSSAGSCSSSVRGGKARLGTAGALCDSGAATQWSWGVPGWAQTSGIGPAGVRSC